MTVRYAHLALTDQLAAVEQLVDVHKAVKSEAATGPQLAPAFPRSKLSKPAYVN